MITKAKKRNVLLFLEIETVLQRLSDHKRLKKPLIMYKMVSHFPIYLFLVVQVVMPVFLPDMLCFCFSP